MKCVRGINITEDASDTTRDKIHLHLLVYIPGSVIDFIIQPFPKCTQSDDV